jgi:hypothetical protein
MLSDGRAETAHAGVYRPETLISLFAGAVGMPAAQSSRQI